MMTKNDWNEWVRYCDKRNSIAGEMIEWERWCNTFHGHIVPIGKDAKEKPWLIGILD